MPAGWMQGQLGAIAAMSDVRTVEPNSRGLEQILAKLFAGDTEGFVAWIGEQTKPLLQAHDLIMRDADLETVIGFMETTAHRPLIIAAAGLTADDQQADSTLPFGDENWKQP